MGFLKHFVLILFVSFIAGCGGGSDSPSAFNPENINFNEKADGSLEIVWEKDGESYNVLAVDGGFELITIYETAAKGEIDIVCTPDNLGATTVTYTCTVTKNGTYVDTVQFELYESQGRYDFVMGWGETYESVTFEDIGEQISTQGLDIEVRYGEYELTDSERTYDEYHGYFLLLENNVAKGREFQFGTTVGDFEFAWSYNRDTKRIVLDNRAAGGGYAEGRVYGNSDNISMTGYWNTGAPLSGTLKYLSDSHVFTRNSKIVSQDLEADSAAGLNAIGSR